MIRKLKSRFNPNNQQYWDNVYVEQEKQGVIKTDGANLDRFLKYFVEAQTILDFGSGRGGNIQYLAGKMSNKKFILTDHSKACLDQCRQMLLSENGNSFEFYQNIEHLDSQKVDMILTIEVLEHISNYREILESLWNVLNDNGFLLISVPVKGWRDRHREHVNKFTLKSMFQELTKYSDLVVISPRTYSKRSNILSTAYFLIQKKSGVK